MNNRKIILWTVMAASLVFIIPQVFILLALGLSPTVVAFIVDKSKKKYAAISVGGMNIAGVIPALLELLKGKNNISAAMDIHQLDEAVDAFTEVGKNLNVLT